MVGLLERHQKLQFTGLHPLGIYLYKTLCHLEDGAIFHKKSKNFDM